MSARTSIGFFLFGILLIVCKVGAAADTSKGEAHALLSQASRQVNLKGPEAVPFMMLAKVTLHDGDKSVNGVYAIAWTPGKFRRVFRFPNFTETDVLAEGILYQQRSTSALPLQIFELNSLLDFFPMTTLGPQTRIQEIDKPAPDQRCFSVEQELSRSKVCLSSKTSLPLSIDRSSDVYQLDALREHYDFSDYQELGNKLFPKKLTFRGWNSRSVEVHVDKLVKVDTFPPDEFLPPEGAKRAHFCENPEVTGQIRPNTGNAVPIGLTDTEVVMYFEANELGGVQAAQVIHSNNPLKDKEILNWFVGTHFPVRRCAGQPIIYEMIETVVTGH